MRNIFAVKMLFLSLISLALLQSCNTSPSEVLPAEGQPSYNQNAYRSLDELLLEVGRELPGFAGFYLDEKGNQVVNIASKHDLHTASVSEVKGAIEKVFGEDYLDQDVLTPSGKEKTSNVRLQYVKYSFEDLDSYFQDALKIGPEFGLMSLDIDEVNNTITVGVESEADAVRVRDILQQFKVPLDAILVEVAEPIQQARIHRLGDKVRPVPAAVRISFVGNDRNEGCTKGFNVTRNGVHGFLVNSHCTRLLGTLDAGKFYNNFVDPNNAIGVEAVDPPFFTSVHCIIFTKCRNSDSAYVRYLDPRDSARRAMPRIRPGILYEFSDQDYRIVLEPFGLPKIGDVLEKVGNVTGLTKMRVSRSCFLVRIGGTNRWLKCQYSTKPEPGYKNIMPGDSGSPVYKVENYTQVRAIGLIWGSSDTEGIFSYAGGIEVDLGRLTWSPCCSPSGD